MQDGRPEFEFHAGAQARVGSRVEPIHGTVALAAHRVPDNMSVPHVNLKLEWRLHRQFTSLQLCFFNVCCIVPFCCIIPAYSDISTHLFSSRCNVGDTVRPQAQAKLLKTYSNTQSTSVCA